MITIEVEAIENYIRNMHVIVLGIFCVCVQAQWCIYENRMSIIHLYVFLEHNLI